MLAAFKLLGYFNGLCGLRMVANRFPSNGKTLFTNKTSGRSSGHMDPLRLLFSGAKKYFCVESAFFDSFSLESFCTISPSSVSNGGGGSGNEVLRLRTI